MYQLYKKILADIVAIYGRGRELFRATTYSKTYRHLLDSKPRDWWKIGHK
jgi:hypothetical protein